MYMLNAINMSVKTHLQVNHGHNVIYNNLMCLFAGYKMYFTLTRHTFGHLQSQLFPVYFTVGSCLSTVALATYYLMHPVQMWKENENIQVNCKTECIYYIGRFANIGASDCLRWDILQLTWI